MQQKGSQRGNATSADGRQTRKRELRGGKSSIKRLSNLQLRLINGYLIFICSTLAAASRGCFPPDVNKRVREISWLM